MSDMTVTHKRHIHRVVIAVCTLALACAVSPVSAETIHTGASNHERTVSVEFAVHAAARPDAGTTFWVAYGPVSGHFVITRLRSDGGGMYAASAFVPPHTRTTVAYLQGHGVLHTRFGAAPGNPVSTIKRVGPVEIGKQQLPAVEWQRPVG